MKNTFILFLFILTWCILGCFLNNINTKMETYNRISYEALICLQDQNCTLTPDEDL